MAGRGVSLKPACESFSLIMLMVCPLCFISATTMWTGMGFHVIHWATPISWIPSLNIPFSCELFLQVSHCDNNAINSYLSIYIYVPLIHHGLHVMLDIIQEIAAIKEDNATSKKNNEIVILHCRRHKKWDSGIKRCHKTTQVYLVWTKLSSDTWFYSISHKSKCPTSCTG